MALGNMHIRSFGKSRLGRVGLWAALLAVFFQMVIPIGHDPIELWTGTRCPGLDLPAASDRHRDAGTARAALDTQSRQSSAQEHGQACPIFQTFLYLAPLGSAGPPPLPAPAFARLHFSLAEWAGLTPAAGSFSRPFPRAPPARA